MADPSSEKAHIAECPCPPPCADCTHPPCDCPRCLVEASPRGIPSGPAAIHFCPVPGCLDIWESEPTCEHAALIPVHEHSWVAMNLKVLAGILRCTECGVTTDDASPLDLCRCGHEEHLHDREAIPPLCTTCGDDESCFGDHDHSVRCRQCRARGCCEHCAGFHADDEVFCPTCLAGIESSEHHEKCDPKEASDG